MYDIYVYIYVSSIRLCFRRQSQDAQLLSSPIVPATHAHAHPHPHAHTHTHTHTRAHTHKHTPPRTHAHTHTQRRMHARTQTQTKTHTDTRTRTHFTFTKLLACMTYSHDHDNAGWFRCNACEKISSSLSRLQIHAYQHVKQTSVYMYMCVCVYICSPCACIEMCINAYIYKYLSIDVCIDMHINNYIYICIPLYVYHWNKDEYICIYLCLHPYMRLQHAEIVKAGRSSGCAHVSRTFYILRTLSSKYHELLHQTLRAVSSEHHGGWTTCGFAHI